MDVKATADLIKNNPNATFGAALVARHILMADDIPAELADFALRATLEYLQESYPNGLTAKEFQYELDNRTMWTMFKPQHSGGD